ncbi:MAG: diphthine--ammonia ligase [Bacteroidota bacterium]|nr:diphthine--ammonia ligase [Bacteroidota bacterium]
MKKAYFNWSSGKDSAMALWKLQQSQEVQVELLLTTINKDYAHVSMHEVPEKLLERQAESLNIPLWKVHLPTEYTAPVYAEILTKELLELRKNGFERAVFGDIFLEDLKRYREEQLKNVGIEAVFPLWKQDTATLMQEFLDSGFRAICVCVNLKYLDRSFCGREIDQNFLNDLPENVDPCGENGEFHTFVFDGPIFRKAVAFKKGKSYTKTYPAAAGKWDAEFAYFQLKA